MDLSRTRTHRCAPSTVLLLAALASTCAVAPPVVPIVRTTGGLVTGTRTRTHVEFRGVPYAAPPVGALRWQPPAPPVPWADVLDARNPAAACPQPPGVLIDGPTSEDCLRVDIYAPQPRASRPLPVLVWLHGGAFRFGGTSTPRLHGMHLAAQGAVVVTVQYRLGVLGWFAHPGLDAAQPAGPCNFGLLDQIAALRWVQDNIAAFGGDPGNVTLAGNAAGATSALYLMCRPDTGGLFHKVILQSPAGFQEPIPRAAAAAFGQRVLAAAGLAGEGASAAELRALPAEALGALDLVAAAGPTFGPILDGVSITEAAQATIAAGREQAVPLLIGSVDDEGSIMAALGVTAQALAAQYADLLPQLRELYPDAADEPAMWRRAWGDANYAAPARWIAAAHAARAPTWLYRFGFVPSGRQGRGTGAGHGDDVPYLFGTMTGTPGPAERWMSEIFSGYWLGFADTGEPRRENAPVWPRHDATADVTMLLQERIGAVTAHDSRPLDWWAELARQRRH